MSATADHPDRADAPGTDPAGHDDIASMSYEAARDELAAIVARLESGRLGLAESMREWERGEALAAHCTSVLDGAQARLEAATAPSAEAATEPPDPARPAAADQVG